MVEYPGFTMSNSPSKIKMFLFFRANQNVSLEIRPQQFGSENKDEEKN